MRSLLLIFFVVITNLCSAQTYSYRFKGSIDQERILKIENDFKAYPEFSDVKFKIKEQSGEILFHFMSQPIKKEEVPTSPAILVKGIIINNGLEPIELVQLP